MGKLLYIKDAGDNWAIADDLPEVRAMLDETPDIWVGEKPPITITELDVDGIESATEALEEQPSNE